MGFYDRHVLPRLTHWSMGHRQLAAYRRRVVAGARGRVVELGVGSGRNLPFYGDGVEEVVGIDPSWGLLAIARRAAGGRRAHLVRGGAEMLPLRDGCADSVVVTWALCTIPDPAAALAEARRVLRPGGRLLFVEHGAAPDPRVRRWQDRLTPYWRRCAGGCHLNRQPDELVRAAGFEIEDLRTGYGSGPKFGTFMYEGAARAPA